MEDKDNSIVLEETPHIEALNKEIARLRRLREDVLLLRFHLARRGDIAERVDATDRLTSETALKSSLEILEGIDNNNIPPAGHVSAAASALMYAVDVLVPAARMAEVTDAAMEAPLTITPESLRASMPKADIAAALGEKPPPPKRKDTSIAGDFLLEKAAWTIVFFVVALTLHYLAAFSFSFKPVQFFENMMITVSALVWAVVGSLVWILVRFRQFGATYSFDPAHAKVFTARICSGAIISAVLLYFVFGGEKPWAGNWRVNLPLWAFVLGYAGRLQVEFLRTMVERVQKAIATIIPPFIGDRKVAASEKKVEERSDEKARGDTDLPVLGKLRKPDAKEHPETPAGNE